MIARRPTNCGTGSSNWQIKTRRAAGMENPVRSEPAASDRARLATNSDLPTLGSPPTNRMPCGGNSPGSTRQGGGVGGCCSRSWASDSTVAAGDVGRGAAHSSASLVASSRIDSSTAAALREAARRKAVRASLLTLRRMPLVA